MPYGFVLFHNGLVRLAVFVLARGVSALVEKEFGFVKIFLVARCEVQSDKCHLGNLVSRHAHLLPLARPDVAAYAVGVPYRYVEEVALARGLVVCHSAFYHVSEVVKLVASLLNLFPSLQSHPCVRMCRVHGACRVQVAVGFLGGRHDGQHAVNVLFGALVGECLEQVARSLDGLVNVGVVKGEAAYAERVARVGRLDEVGVSS